MSSSNATLAIFTPGNVEVPSGGQVALTKSNLGTAPLYGGIDTLRFQGQAVGQGSTSAAIWDAVLPRGANGYTGTTGIKALVTWWAPKTSLAVAWAGSFQLNGATDLPAPAVENFPAYDATNEVVATGNCNTTTYGGMVQTLLTIPIAKIQNGQTTAPAAGDMVRFRLRRATENTGDTLTDYAYVNSVELYDY
jgi:hypothetical protein